MGIVLYFTFISAETNRGTKLLEAVLIKKLVGISSKFFPQNNAVSGKVLEPGKPKILNR